MGETKANQVSFKVDDQTVARIQAGMNKEDIASQADFCRKINKYGLELFEKLGSLSEMRKYAERITLERDNQFQETLRLEADTSEPQPGTGTPSEKLKSMKENISTQVRAHAVKQAQQEKEIHARTTKKLTHVE